MKMRLSKDRDRDIRYSVCIVDTEDILYELGYKVTLWNIFDTFSTDTIFKVHYIEGVGWRVTPEYAVQAMPIPHNNCLALFNDLDTALHTIKTWIANARAALLEIKIEHDRIDSMVQTIAGESYK